MPENNSEIEYLLHMLEEKYSAMGQDMVSYLEGLLYNDYVKYWDYIELDTLLSLQKPRTSIPDENIFIMYHQITELYFKLCLLELEQITSHENLDAAFFTTHLTRVNRYFENLTRSFDIMVDGMEPEQFLKFRMSLLPASGFQSVQYRTIEIYATNFLNLVSKDLREKYNENSEIKDMFNDIYWKEGATVVATGKKTLTLEQFEKKYSAQLIRKAKEMAEKNIWQCFLKLEKENKSSDELKNTLRVFDASVNINWPLVHYKSAVRYLQKDPSDVAATGGTNWQKYLPARIQRRIFYPSLWTVDELEDWGKGFRFIKDF